MDDIERDFRAALQRLLDGQPRNKQLKEKAKAGKLRINPSSVALEAGRSRTLIGLDDCRYPAVRQAIKESQPESSKEPTTYTQLIANLRAEIAKLKAEKRLLESAMVDHVLGRRKAEVSSKRDAVEAADLRKRLAELEKIVQLPTGRPSPAQLVLIRGLPGSGKSTRARGYASDGYKHLEADQYFLVDGRYDFDESKLQAAHAWCLAQTREALAAGELVCVANVFATIEDVKPYADLNVDFQIIEAKHKGSSVHNVPDSKLQAMRSVWVSTERLLEVYPNRPSGLGTVTPIASKRGKV